MSRPKHDDRLTKLRGNDYLLQIDQFQQYYDALPENMVPSSSFSSQTPYLTSLSPFSKPHELTPSPARPSPILCPVPLPPVPLQRLDHPKPLLLSPTIRRRFGLPRRLRLPPGHDGEPLGAVPSRVSGQGDVQILLRRDGAERGVQLSAGLGKDSG